MDSVGEQMHGWAQSAGPSDGELDLVGLAEAIDEPAWELVPLIDRLRNHELLEAVEPDAELAGDGEAS